MWAVLDAVRDAVVSLALAWIGVVVEPAPQAAPASGGAAASVCADANKSSPACARRAPGFDAQPCANQN